MANIADPKWDKSVWRGKGSQSNIFISFLYSGHDSAYAAVITSQDKKINGSIVGNVTGNILRGDYSLSRGRPLHPGEAGSDECKITMTGDKLYVQFTFDGTVTGDYVRSGTAVPVPPPVIPQPPKTYTRSLATMSWIDPKAGLPEYDHGGYPGANRTRETILGRSAYRFANFLEAVVTVDSNGSIVDAQFTSASNLYMNPVSFQGISPKPYPIIRRIERQDDQSATFYQTVGAQTVSSQVIGNVVGTGVGTLVGGRVAWMIVRGVAAEYFIPVTIITLLAGAIVGGNTGGAAGELTASAVRCFPPIWTTLVLTIRSDGSVSRGDVTHSMFPSMTFYGSSDNKAYWQAFNYDGVPNLAPWGGGWGTAFHQSPQGWGPVRARAPGTAYAYAGNPWNVECPVTGPPEIPAPQYDNLKARGSGATSESSIDIYRSRDPSSRVTHEGEIIGLRGCIGRFSGSFKGNVFQGNMVISGPNRFSGQVAVEFTIQGKTLNMTMQPGYYAGCFSHSATEMRFQITSQ